MVDSETSELVSASASELDLSLVASEEEAFGFSCSEVSVASEVASEASAAGTGEDDDVFAVASWASSEEVSAAGAGEVSLLGVFGGSVMRREEKRE